MGGFYPPVVRCAAFLHCAPSLFGYGTNGRSQTDRRRITMKGISSLLGKSAGTGLLGVLLSVSSFPVPVQPEPGDGPHTVVEITGGCRAVGQLIIPCDAQLGRACAVAPRSRLNA